MLLVFSCLRLSVYYFGYGNFQIIYHNLFILFLILKHIL